MSSFARIMSPAVVAAALSLAGCSKSDSEKAADSLNKVVDKSKSAMGSIDDSATEFITAKFGKQLDAYRPQIDSLKASAGELKDTQLDALVKTVQEKYSEFTAKVKAAKDGDTSALDSLRAEGVTKMFDLKIQFDKAMTRLSELKASKPPTP